MDKQTILSKLAPRFSAKKVLVLGLGKEGQASFRFLLNNYAALNIKELAIADISEDSCQNCQSLAKEQYPYEIKTYSGENYLSAITKYDLVLKSPGISFKAQKYLADDITDGLPRLAQAPRTEITCQVDLFLQIYGNQTVTVSGTKGKSTTSTLISELLKACDMPSKLLGNIGIAAFNELFSLANQTATLELSCHQLEFTEHSGSVALLTNFYPEHLDHYHNLAEYYQAKLNLVRFGQAGQIIVLPAYEASLVDLALTEVKEGQRIFFLCRCEDDLDNLQAIYQIRKIKAPAYAFTYNLKQGRLAFLGDLLLANYKCPISAGNLHLTFSKQLLIEHLQLDSILAVIATFAYHLRQAEMKNSTESEPLAAWLSFSKQKSECLNKCLENFKGLEHRLQYIGQYKQHPVYNDSISTIPLAAIKALEALPVCQTIILGGLDRGLDYSTLEAYLSDKKLNVIGLQDTGWRLIDNLSKQITKLNLYKVENMQAAVQTAYAVTEKGRGILLSPAAASYNTYKDFEERGFDFIAEIQKQAQN